MVGFASCKPADRRTCLNVSLLCNFNNYSANVAINGSKFGVSSGVVPEVTSDVTSSSVMHQVTSNVTGDVIDTSSCGRTKLCMRESPACDGTSCDWLMTSRDVGEAYDIELSATVTQTNSWVAFGLSRDEKMVSTQ